MADIGEFVRQFGGPIKGAKEIESPSNEAYKRMQKEILEKIDRIKSKYARAVLEAHDVYVR